MYKSIFFLYVTVHVGAMVCLNKLNRDRDGAQYSREVPNYSDMEHRIYSYFKQRNATFQ